MHGSDALTGTIQNGLGIYYMLVVVLNLGFAAYYFSASRNKAQGLLWVVVSGLFLVHALAYFGHLGWMLPRGFRDSVTNMMGAMGGQLGPIVYTVLSVLGFVLFLRYRALITRPTVAWGIL